MRTSDPTPQEAQTKKRRTIIAQPLTQEAFLPFGDVLEATGAPDRLVNRGRCGRYHNRALLDAMNGNLGISLHLSEKREAPIQLNSVARHPLGSQAFIPMTENPYLITVARDENNQPGQVVAFLCGPGQGVNYHKNTWHGVLMPLDDPGLFAVIDYVGDAPNMDDFWFDRPYLVAVGQ